MSKLRSRISVGFGSATGVISTFSLTAAAATTFGNYLSIYRGKKTGPQESADKMFVKSFCAFFLANAITNSPIPGNVSNFVEDAFASEMDTQVQIQKEDKNLIAKL